MGQRTGRATRGWYWFAGITTALALAASGYTALASMFAPMVTDPGCGNVCAEVEQRILLGMVFGFASSPASMLGGVLSLVSKRPWLRWVGIALMVVPLVVAWRFYYSADALMNGAY